MPDRDNHSNVLPAGLRGTHGEYIDGDIYSVGYAGALDIYDVNSPAFGVYTALHGGGDYEGTASVNVFPEAEFGILQIPLVCSVTAHRVEPEWLDCARMEYP